MAILSVNEVESSRSGGVVWTSSMNRNYTRKFRVIVDDPSYGPGSICDAPGIPLPFAPYSTGDGTDFDLAALNVKTSADMQVPDDRLIWIVTVDYSTEMPEGGPSKCFFGNEPAGPQNNPEEEPWVIGWEPEVVTKARDRDLDGKPYWSSAGKPFKPTPSFECARAVLTFTRNQRDFPRSLITDYSFSVNKDVFLGAPVGSAQCMPPTAKLMFRGGLMYWRVTWKIRFGANDPHADGGIEKFSPIYILDQDTFHIQEDPGSPDVGKPVPIFRQGVPVTDPLLLDGNGQPLVTPLDEPIPVYLPFNQQSSQPFNDIFGAGLGAVTP